MNIRALQSLIQKQPFEPFEIVISSGDRYPIIHPENCMITKECAVVAFKDAAGEFIPPDSFALLSYLHISATEPLGKRKTSGRKR